MDKETSASGETQYLHWHTNWVIDKSAKHKYIKRHYCNTIYSQYVYENVDMNYALKCAHQLYCKTKVQSSLFFLCLAILNFKRLFLLLEVGMRFIALHNESNYKWCVVEYISNKICDYLMLLFKANTSTSTTSLVVYKFY